LKGADGILKDNKALHSTIIFIFGGEIKDPSTCFVMKERRRVV